MSGPIQELPGDIEDTPKSQPTQYRNRRKLPEQNKEWYTTTLTGATESDLGIRPVSDRPLETRPPPTIDEYRNSVFDNISAVEPVQAGGALEYKDLLSNNWDELPVEQKVTIIRDIHGNMSADQKRLHQQMQEFEYYKKKQTFTLGLAFGWVVFIAASILLIGLGVAILYTIFKNGVLGEEGTIANTLKFIRDMFVFIVGR